MQVVVLSDRESLVIFYRERNYEKHRRYILFVKIINPIDEKVELVNCEWKKKEKEKEGAEIFNCEIDRVGSARLFLVS